MCDPISMGVTMAALSGGQQGMQIAQQNKQAEAKADAAAAAAEQNIERLEERQSQTQDASVAKQRERQLQGKRERAKLDVAFGNANITGNTPLRQLHTARIQEGKDVGQIQTNAENEINQIEHQQEAASTKAEGRIDQARARATEGWMSALQIGTSAASGGLQGYTSGKAMQPD